MGKSRYLAVGLSLAAVAFVFLQCYAARAGQTSRTASGDPGERAAAILQRHCAKCHGDRNAPNGNLFSLSDRAGMLQKGQLAPGHPESSRIYIRAALSPGDPMPPAGARDALTDAEKRVLKEWIEGGAGAAKTALAPPQSRRSNVSEADVLKDIAADVASARSDLRSEQRYFLLAHLANSGASEADLQQYRTALSRLINSLSWATHVAVPKTLAGSGTVLRIRLSDYGWTPATWRRLLADYPYRTAFDSPAARSVAAATECELPCLRADWFIANAAIPPLYHDLLQIPPTFKELKKRLDLPFRGGRSADPVYRAGFSESGVSRNNRIVERSSTGYGSLWRSFDFRSNSGNQNIFENPFTFQEAGGEIIFNLPNGLQGYMLVNAKGERIDAAPTDIVSNKEDPNDPVVRNGLTCMSCHAQGMKRFDDRADELRNVLFARPHDGNDAQRSKALFVYTEKLQFKYRLTVDSKRFAEAVAKTGSEVQQEDPSVVLAKRYRQPVSAVQAAAELGLSESEFKRKLNSTASLAGLRAVFKSPGAVVKRDSWEQYFPVAARDSEIPNVLEIRDFNTIRPFQGKIGGILYASTGPRETAQVSFKHADGVVTKQTYSGLVMIDVTGFGGYTASEETDAFYHFPTASNRAPTLARTEGQLTFGTKALQDGTTDYAAARIVGGVPPYSTFHCYTFVLDTGLKVPGTLHFGLAARDYAGYHGFFLIHVTQLQPQP